MGHTRLSKKRRTRSSFTPSSPRSRSTTDISEPLQRRLWSV
jgi:hypothetical protein